jgi:hypothetical protein
MFGIRPHKQNNYLISLSQAKLSIDQQQHFQPWKMKHRFDIRDLYLQGGEKTAPVTTVWS